jgi:hypothetical protein
MMATVHLPLSCHPLVRTQGLLRQVSLAATHSSSSSSSRAGARWLVLLLLVVLLALLSVLSRLSREDTQSR